MEVAAAHRGPHRGVTCVTSVTPRLARVRWVTSIALRMSRRALGVTSKPVTRRCINSGLSVPSDAGDAGNGTCTMSWSRLLLAEGCPLLSAVVINLRFEGPGREFFRQTQALGIYDESNDVACRRPEIESLRDAGVHIC